MSLALSAFLLERHPFAVSALARADGDLEKFRAELERELLSLASGESTPGVAAHDRVQRAIDEVLAACDGFLRREAIAASLTSDEKREILRGMLLTRATDNRLKQFFTGGEVRCGNASFQGKGFRSLGQEAIYAARDPSSPRRGTATSSRR